MSEKRKYNKEQNPNLFEEFKSQNKELIIEFPLYLKNRKPDNKPTLYWRYHIDGRYELISFGKNNNSFTYGVNEYWSGKDEYFENLFILRQIYTNDQSDENEFIEKMKELFSTHNTFMGNKKIQNDQEISESENNKTLYKRVQKKSTGKDIGGIIVKVEGEEDPF